MSCWQYLPVVPRRPVTTVPGILVLASVSVAMFLYCFPAATTLLALNPPHAWTSVDWIDYHHPWPVEIAIRQAWIFGPWMHVLDKDTLLTALAIQNRLVSGDITLDDGKAHNAVHSVLDSWECDAERILADDDVAGTLHRASQRQSRLGITMRTQSTLAWFTRMTPSSSGEVVSADDLTMTMLCDDASEARRLWDEGVEALLRDHPDKWHPSWNQDAHGGRARIQHRAASVADGIVFLALYGAAALRIWIGMARRTMFRSRFWI